MDHNKFLKAWNLLTISLINQVMDRTYNSVGSNIFFEFGKQKEVMLRNGKKRLQKEWAIWLSWTSWRISQHHKYVIGSDESPEISIQTHLEKLLGKRILSLRFLSSFLDLEINFENGYQVTTFFNYIQENQWIIFLPNVAPIVIDCSSEKAIEFVQNLSTQIEIKNKYEHLELSFSDAEVKKIVFHEKKLSQIICTKDFSIDLGSSAWRLKKHEQYQGGRKDYYFDSLEGKSKELEDKLLDLIGKKIKCVGIDPSGMDMKLDLEEECVFEIFTHTKDEPWKIHRKNEVILSAKTVNTGE